MPRKSPKEPISSSNRDEESLDRRAEATVRNALSLLDDLLAAARFDFELARTQSGQKEGGFMVNLAREVANLAGRSAGIMDTLRKRELAWKKLVGDMTPDEQGELVKEFVQEMQPARFKKFREWLNQLEEDIDER